MSESGDSNNTSSNKRTLPEEIFKYLTENNYLIFYAIAVFLYSLAFSAETVVGPVSVKGEADIFSKKIILSIATVFLLIALFTHFSLALSRKKLRANIENTSLSSNERKLNEAVNRASAEYDDYSQVLHPYSVLGEESLRQDELRNRLTRWMSHHPHKDDWINGAVSQKLIEELSPQYIPVGRGKIFRADIRQYVDMITESIRRGEPHTASTYGFKRNIDSIYPYEKALEEVKREILVSLDNSTEMNDRQLTDKAKQMVSDFINTIVREIETSS